MKRILIKPLHPNGLNGRLLEAAYPGPFNKWKIEAEELGFELMGWDMAPMETADCVWFWDLSTTKKEFLLARSKAKLGVPFVLQVVESPLGRQHNFHPKNQWLFDYVVSYDPKKYTSQPTFNYKLPNCFDRYWHKKNISFERRRCAVMINNNKLAGWMTTRKPGLIGLPGIGPNFSGWSFSIIDRIFPGRGDLYSWRRRFAREAWRVDPECLDIYGGYGWSGEPISWNRFYKNDPYLNFKGSIPGEKMEVISRYRFSISVENYLGDRGYISEKLFDSLIAGAVPVCLGDKKITESIPKEVFVDARDFADNTSLIKFLMSCPKAKWEKMQAAGQEFLHSPTAQEFSTPKYVSSMNSILKKILARPK